MADALEKPGASKQRSNSQAMIKQGFLEKEGSVMKSWKKRWFVLDSCVLAYYEEPKDTEPKGQMSIYGAKVSLNGDSGHDHCAEIKTQNRSLLIAAESAGEIEEWIVAIREAVDRFKGVQSPPAWKNSDMCYSCQAMWSLTNRRHHCRSCGNSHCNDCSDRALALPQYGMHLPVRVCNKCYTSFRRRSLTNLSAEALASAGSQESVRSMHAPHDEDSGDELEAGASSDAKENNTMSEEELKKKERELYALRVLNATDAAAKERASLIRSGSATQGDDATTEEKPNAEEKSSEPQEASQPGEDAKPADANTAAAEAPAERAEEQAQEPPQAEQTEAVVEEKEKENVAAAAQQQEEEAAQQQEEQQAAESESAVKEQDEKQVEAEPEHEAEAEVQAPAKTKESPQKQDEKVQAVVPETKAELKEDPVETLQKGVSVYKVAAGSGKAKTTTLKLVKVGYKWAVAWDSAKKKPEDAQIMLDTAQLLRGQKTDVFKRKNNQAQFQQSSHVSFSLVSPTRSLDIVCTTQEHYEKWIEAIESLKALLA